MAIDRQCRCCVAAGWEPIERALEPCVRGKPIELGGAKQGLDGGSPFPARSDPADSQFILKPESVISDSAG